MQNRSNLEEIIQHTPILTATRLRQLGVQPRDVIAATDDGLVVRPHPGLVVTAAVYADPDFDDAFACARTGGVIGRLSAGQRHGLCQALPQKLEMLTSEKVARPPIGSPMELFRSRDGQHVLAGIEERGFHKVWRIRMTEPARTVVDLYRINPRGIRQHALAALAEYLERDLPVDRLYEMAEIFDAWPALKPAVEALQEAQSRGMMP